MTDDDWPDSLSSCRVDVLRLNQAEAQRSRLRKPTEGGTEVMVCLERGTPLHDGDVLHWDERTRTAVVARVDLADVLVIDLSGLLGERAETVLARCVEVGHALGNQHWPAVVKGSQVYVPLTVSAEVMAAVMKTHGFERVTFMFAPGEDVLPSLGPREAQRLFGGAVGHHHHAGPGPSGGPAS